MGFFLVIRRGGDEGREIELVGSEILLGSAPVCQVVLSEPTVSRVHCRLKIQGDVLSIFDEKSTNGTLVNDRLVNGEGEIAVGDRLRVGPFEFQLCFRDADPIASGAGKDKSDTADLYQRAMEHDEEAARQLYYRFLPRITRFAERSLGSQLKRVVDPEDVAQEVLVEALIEVAAYDFRKQGSFMAFLQHKLRHVICDHSRYWSAQKRSTQRTVSLENATEVETDSYRDNRLLGPEVIFGLDEQLDRMRRGMASLPREQRKLIQWAKIEERPYDDIAHSLGISRDAVRMRVARALAELQAAFDRLA